MKRLSPSQAVVFGFLLAIAAGTLYLQLPIALSPQKHLTFIDSLFTATSATCVTGLTVVDTGTFFSRFGQLGILLLIQCGGLGIMAFSTIFAVLFGRKITVRDNLTFQNTVTHQVENLPKLLLYITFSTVTIELFGALVLFLRWAHTASWGVAETIYQSVFHSVSAFCNAGFSTFSDSLGRFRADPVINIAVMFLIIVGGVGFVVLVDVGRVLSRRAHKGIPHRMTLHSKIVLVVTGVLLVGGTLVLFLLERTHSFAQLPLSEKVLAAAFQSVTARTAGFNTVPIGALSGASLFFIIILMFIGASPGSTGGGIKTVTAMTVIASFIAMSRGRERVTIFRRSIPRAVVSKSVAIFIIALLSVVGLTFLMQVVMEDVGIGRRAFLKLFFEATSAFGTVGLSTGITANLTPAAKLLIILGMFAGRVGPLTLALAVALREEKQAYTYPDEGVMVG